MFMDKEGTTLATEIFKELKASARRWFIAFLVMLGMEIFTIVGFLWYISLPVEETSIMQNMDDIDGSNISQKVGDEYGTGIAKSDLQTASSTE